MNEAPFPDVPDTLIKELDRRFPERCPDMKWTDREVWFNAGARSIVRFLIEQQKRHNDRNTKGQINV